MLIYSHLTGLEYCHFVPNCGLRMKVAVCRHMAPVKLLNIYTVV